MSLRNIVNDTFIVLFSYNCYLNKVVCVKNHRANPPTHPHTQTDITNHILTNKNTHTHHYTHHHYHHTYTHQHSQPSTSTHHTPPDAITKVLRQSLAD